MIIGGTLIIVVLILLSLAQEMNRRWQVQREIQKLDNDVRQLQTNVIELEQLNQYFRTDDYQERLAREKLNFRAPGEQVVLIPENQLSGEAAEQQVIPEAGRPLSNPLRWWHIFFVDTGAPGYVPNENTNT